MNTPTVLDILVFACIPVGALFIMMIWLKYGSRWYKK